MRDTSSPATDTGGSAASPLPEPREPKVRYFAGPKLDAVIAEKVMGWTHHPDRDPCFQWERPSEGNLLGRLAALGPDLFSTDMTAAWGVAEKLTGFVSGREHPWWSVAVFNAQRNQVGCRVYACPPGSSIFDAEEVIAEAVADTAPLAICLAALIAIATEPSHV